MPEFNSATQTSYYWTEENSCFPNSGSYTVGKVPCGRFWINQNHLGEMGLAFLERKPAARHLNVSFCKLYKYTLISTLDLRIWVKRVQGKTTTKKESKDSCLIGGYELRCGYWVS